MVREAPGQDVSRAWAKGSTTAWRRLRAQVLQRDEYQCQLRLDECVGLERWSLTGKGQAHAHHIKGRAITGDDPRWIVCACGPCNLAVGDPKAQRHDPAPTPHSSW